MENIFKVDKQTQKKLGVNTGIERNMTEEILQIFEEAEKKYGKTELSIDEITIAYYNMFTKPNNLQMRDKKSISMKLFLMKGGKKDDGILENVRNGVYRIRNKKND